MKKRGAVRAWSAVLATLAIVIGLADTAPLAGQGLSWELRVGAVTSSPVAQDQVANPSLIDDLDGTFLGGVKADPRTGVLATLAAATPLRARTSLELALAWSYAALDAVDNGGRRKIRDLHTAHAALSVRYRVAGPVEAGCGIGMLRYLANDGLFANGAELAPLVECGGGVRAGPRGLGVVRVLGQAHRFRTAALRDTGGRSGTVLRIAVQAGVHVGGRR